MLKADGERVDGRGGAQELEFGFDVEGATL